MLTKPLVSTMVRQGFSSSDGTTSLYVSCEMLTQTLEPRGGPVPVGGAWERAAKETEGAVLAVT